MTLADVGLVERWDASLRQLRSHHRGCACDPCCQARAFFDRIETLIVELFGD